MFNIFADITIEWNSLLQEVTVSWADVFQSESPLYFEVSVGTVRGGGDIVQRQETKNTVLIFKLSKADIGPYGKAIYSVVTAITPAGTYKTVEKDKLIILDE